MGKSKSRGRNKTRSRSSIQEYDKLIQQQLRQVIRRVWSRYSIERKQVLQNAKRYKKRPNKDGSISNKPNIVYICNSCQEQFKKKDIQVDHIIPVGKTPDFPPDGLEWVFWLDRLFCSIENLQVLCLSCHKQKSKIDRKTMAKYIDPKEQKRIKEEERKKANEELVREARRDKSKR